MGPVRLWVLSAHLRHRGHRRLALAVKKLNSFLYHNSLAPGTAFSPDVRFGHHGFGTMIHSNVTIGKGVRIGHNVTIAVNEKTGGEQRIEIGDGVHIGSNSVLLAPGDRSLSIGAGARIGAGALVVRDVPAGATVISAPSRVLEGREAADAAAELGDTL